MQLNKRIAGNREENLQIGFLILIILPVLFLFYFNHPTTEDFYWGEIVKKAGFIDGQRFFLKYWGGRFTYYILMSLNPLFFNSIPAYNILLFLIMVSSVIILYLFISQFTGNSLTFKDKLFFTLSIFFLYLYAMPSIGQGLFCLGFIICYHLGIMLMLLFFIIYNRQIYTGNEKTKILYTIICCFVALAIAGLNELSATIFLISIVLLLTKNLFVNKKINWSLVIFVIVTIIAVYIAFTSAGNSQRSKQYTDAHQLFYSVYNSGIFLLQQVVSWTINSPLPAFTFLLIPVFLKIIKTDKRFSDIYSINPIYSVTILLVLLYTGIFIMLWSVGIYPYDRILNILYFLFLIGWFYNMIVLSYYISRKFNMSILKFSRYLNAIAYIIIIFFLIRENNIRTAYSDLLEGDAQKFSNIMNERYGYIQQVNSDSCEIDSIAYVPKTFFFMDINYDPNSVYNQGYAPYFKKKSIVLKSKKN